MFTADFTTLLLLLCACTCVGALAALWGFCCVASNYDAQVAELYKFDKGIQDESQEI